MIGAITGVLASRTAQYEYFTTILYPFVVDDSLLINNPVISGGVFWENPNDDSTILNPVIMSGTLVDTIVYKIYDEPFAIENATILNPVIMSGTLVDTIAYIEYNNGAIEDMEITLPTILSGTLI